MGMGIERAPSPRQTRVSQAYRDLTSPVTARRFDTTSVRSKLDTRGTISDSPPALFGSYGARTTIFCQPPPGDRSVFTTAPEPLVQ
jgi:hypothetical protein